MEKKFFVTVLSAMLVCLLSCIFQFANIEYRYELLNFIESRKVITLSPRQMARQYILALKKKDYKIAYNYLTPESRGKFSLADFVILNEKLMTEMNENKTWIYYEEVRVGMQIYEDPGSWGYMLVKTDGKWKIVMKSGIPSFPFIVESGWCLPNEK